MQTVVETSHPGDSVTGVGGDDGALPGSGELRAFSRTLPFSVGHRNLLALLLFLGTCAWFRQPLVELYHLAFQQEHFSHILLIPCVSLYLLFLDRTAILTSRQWSPAFGLLALGVGAFSYWGIDIHDWTPDHLAMAIAEFVMMCWSLFLFSFGGTSFRKNSFALLFLLFMTPLPSVLLDAIIGFLQRSSAEVTDFFFSILGIPVFRQGFVFSLSQFTIHVAEECSGIRSFLSLFITSLVTGHWFLKSGWSKVGLAVFVVPLAIIKNAFRIVGLALLANYVDPTYITNSALHRGGGIPLFLVSLVVLFLVVWLLRKIETRTAPKAAR